MNIVSNIRNAFLCSDLGCSKMRSWLLKTLIILSNSERTSLQSIGAGFHYPFFALKLYINTSKFSFAELLGENPG